MPKLHNIHSCSISKHKHTIIWRMYSWLRASTKNIICCVFWTPHPKCTYFHQQSNIFLLGIIVQQPERPLEQKYNIRQLWRSYMWDCSKLNCPMFSKTDLLVNMHQLGKWKLDERHKTPLMCMFLHR
jgi:hypothetical protein